MKKLLVLSLLAVSVSAMNAVEPEAQSNPSTEVPASTSANGGAATATPAAPSFTARMKAHASTGAQAVKNGASTTYEFFTKTKTRRNLSIAALAVGTAYGVYSLYNWYLAEEEVAD